MDALSDALRVLQLTGAVFIDVENTAPWCVVSHSGNPAGQEPMSGPDILFFHVFTEGRCKARLAGGGDTVDLRAGDLLLLPRDDQHLLGSDLLLPPTPADRLVQPAGDRGYLRIEHGGGGEKTRFVCGYLRFDERLCAPILRTLPRILCVHLGEAQIPVWISNLLQIGMRETAASQPGGGTLLVKLSELLFEIGRAHV